MSDVDVSRSSRTRRGGADDLPALRCRGGRSHCVRAIRDLPEEGCFLSGEVPGLLQAVHNLGSQDDLRALSAPANTSIVKCVAREKLESEHAEFYQSLVAKEEKLGFKRK